MSGTDEGGTAFPFTPTDRSGQCGEAYPGMTLRDYFAAKALESLIREDMLARVLAGNKGTQDQHLARASYYLADAMLAERNKETPR